MIMQNKYTGLIKHSPEKATNIRSKQFLRQY